MKKAKTIRSVQQHGSRREPSPTVGPPGDGQRPARAVAALVELENALHEAYVKTVLAYDFFLSKPNTPDRKRLFKIGRTVAELAERVERIKNEVLPGASGDSTTSG